VKKILLLADPASASNVIVIDAAASACHTVCPVANTRRAFEVLQHGIPKVDLLIVDLDWQFHPMALLEAIAACKNTPPVIVLTELDEEYMDKVARQHGAAACLGKPFTAARLASLIRRLLSSEKPIDLSCDLWGHPKLPHSLRKQVA